MPLFRPMLCTEGSLKEEDLSKLRYPVYVSPKLDGIRSTTQPIGLHTQPISRTGKLIPNRYIQKRFMELVPNRDGELIVGSPTDPLCYNKTQSAVMSHGGTPDFTYWVFDKIDRRPFEDRFLSLTRETLPDFCQYVPQHFCQTPQEILDLYEGISSQGFEGICIRPSIGRYKHGRAVFSNQALFRMKPLEHSEARIIGVNPLKHNTNDPTSSPLGYTERASHAHNLVEMAIVGSFDCVDIHSGVEFSVGTFKGFGLDIRSHWWSIRDRLLNRVFTYSHFPVGALHKPRQPVFKGWRTDLDL